MFFYLLTVPVLMASIYMAYKLRELEKHDRVLYRFCAVRRNAMAVIRDKSESLSQEEYAALRDVVSFSGLIIHDYHNFKLALFHLRLPVRHVSLAKEVEVQADSRPVLCDDVACVQNDFVTAVARAILSFVPAPKLAIFVISVLLRLIGSLNRK